MGNEREGYESSSNGGKAVSHCTELPPGQERQDAFREISKFRDKIAALKDAERSAQGPRARDD